MLRTSRGDARDRSRCIVRTWLVFYSKLCSRSGWTRTNEARTRRIYSPLPLPLGSPTGKSVEVESNHRQREAGPFYRRARVADTRYPRRRMGCGSAGPTCSRSAQRPTSPHVPRSWRYSRYSWLIIIRSFRVGADRGCPERRPCSSENRRDDLRDREHPILGAVLQPTPRSTS